MTKSFSVELLAKKKRSMFWNIHCVWTAL